MKRLYTSFLIALLTFAWPALSPAGTPVRVGVYQNTPMSFIEENGQVRGFFIDILQHVARKEGWQLQYIPGTWPQCLQRLKRGDIDLLGVIAYSKERSRFFDYTYENVYSEWARVYTHAREGIETILDLDGKKIAVLQGDMHYSSLKRLANWFSIHPRFIEADDYDTVLGIVAAGKCDAGVVSHFYGMYHENDWKVYSSPVIFSPQKLYFAAPKGKNLRLLGALDRHLREMKAQGQPHAIYHRALQKWMARGGSAKTPTWLLWAIGTSAALLLLFFATSLILRSQVKARTRELYAKNRQLEAEVQHSRQTEQALKLTQFAIEHSGEAAFWMGPDARFTYVNQAACDSLGYSRQELLSMTVHDIDPGFPRQTWPQHWQEIKRHKTLTIESLHRTKSGKTFPVEITSNYINYEGKEYNCAFVRNITERKRITEEKARLEAQLVQAQKMEAIGTLAGGIAHDFNNILSAIMGYAELTLIELPDNSPFKNNLQEVLQGARRAKDLVQQILAFSRQSKQERKPIRITPIVREALKMLRASLPTTIAIRQQVPADIGIIEIDPTQIHQVLMNLCTNAAHAMNHKGGILELTVANVDVSADTLPRNFDLPPGKYVRLTVKDTGHGMSPEVLKRIFEPYFTTKEKGVGTGMGLAVVHGILKSHGGTVTVESAPGKGTRFDVYLPRIEKAVKPQIRKDTHFPTGNERILFIDDEVALVDIGKQMLEKLGYKVETRTSSVEALELFKSQPAVFDLVITDMTMPNMTGDQLAKELLAIRPDIPVILCTGYSEQITAAKARQMGIRAFVLKPIIMHDIARRIRQALDASRQA